jgi:hypothetical protein
MYTINYPDTIDLKLLLKGSDTLSVNQNIDIFIKVQKGTCKMRNEIETKRNYNDTYVLYSEKKMTFRAFHSLTLSIRCEELDTHIN